MLAPTRPNPTPPTWLAQEAQTGQTSLEGDSRTANARPTPRGRRQAWLGHPAVAPDHHRASQGPPQAAKGQNKGQHLELRADPALEGAQNPALHPSTLEPKSGGWTPSMPRTGPGTAPGSSGPCDWSVLGAWGHPEGTNTVTLGQRVTFPPPTGPTSMPVQQCPGTGDPLFLLGAGECQAAAGHPRPLFTCKPWEEKALPSPPISPPP